jgi:hypothetical protein
VFLFHTEVKGKPGSATIVGVNQGPGGGSQPPIFITGLPTDETGCFEGADLKVIPNLDAPQNENSLVATFKDLSVLNMARDDTRLVASTSSSPSSSSEVLAVSRVPPERALLGASRCPSYQGRTSAVRWEQSRERLFCPNISPRWQAHRIRKSIYGKGDGAIRLRPFLSTQNGVTVHAGRYLFRLPTYL